MAKYKVAVPIYASVFVTVEAESEEEAIKNAEENYHASLCCHCSKGVELGEFDESATSDAFLVE